MEGAGHRHYFAEEKNVFTMKYAGGTCYIEIEQRMGQRVINVIPFIFKYHHHAW